jgi:hypothetical protein
VLSDYYTAGREVCCAGAVRGCGPTGGGAAGGAAIGGGAVAGGSVIPAPGIATVGGGIVIPGVATGPPAIIGIPSNIGPSQVAIGATAGQHTAGSGSLRWNNIGRAVPLQPTVAIQQAARIRRARQV